MRLAAFVFPITRETHFQASAIFDLTLMTLNGVCRRQPVNLVRKTIRYGPEVISRKSSGNKPPRGVVCKRRLHRLMLFLWKNGFKLYVTMVVVLMDRINLLPQRFVPKGPELYLFSRLRKLFQLFHLRDSEKSVAFQFLGSRYELDIIRLEFLFNVLCCE